jgi:hypothetical protein
MLLSMWKLSHFKLIWKKLLRSFYMNIFKPNLGAHLPLLWPKLYVRRLSVLLFLVL